MELWIRSQDKEQLRKIVDLKYQKGTIKDDNCEAIIGTTQYDEWEVLGIYKSKERALEVLDEIQRTITKQLVNRHKQLDGNYSFEVIDTAIYEMPKE